jgi:hypothetical protein
MSRELSINLKKHDVQAFLDNRKTQHRIPVKIPGMHLLPMSDRIPESIHKDGSGTGWIAWMNNPVSAEETVRLYPGKQGFKSKFQPGDILWVKETWLEYDRDHVINSRYAYKANSDADTEEIRKAYIAAGRNYHWRPSIHMPKAAARIWLRVKDVGVERLQDITWQGIQLEGILTEFSGIDGIQDLEEKYISMTDSIHGLGTWERNDWVWVYEFEVLKDSKALI